MARSTQSRLLNYRQRNGLLFFRVAESAEYDSLVRELKRRVPARARQFSRNTLEWSVNLEYREIVEELFSGATPISEGEGSRRSRRFRAQSGANGQIIWLVLILTAIFTVGAIFWADEPAFLAADVQPTVTPLPMIAPTIAVQPSEATVNSTANLRAGPGLLYAVTGQAVNGDRFIPQSRAQDSEGFWWFKLDQERWIRSDLMVSTAPGGLPLNLASIPEEGSVQATPTVIP